MTKDLCAEPTSEISYLAANYSAPRRWLCAPDASGNKRQQGREFQSDFLGRPTAFPESSLVLASLLETSGYLLFCFKVNGGYAVHLVSIANLQIVFNAPPGNSKNFA